MSDNKNVRFTVKAVINKQKTRVLFAEIDYDFADILLSFSTLPLRLVIRALLMHYGDKTPVIGCLNNLYKGLKIRHNDCKLFSEDARFRPFPSGHIRSSCDTSENEYFCSLYSYSQHKSFIICEDMRIVADVVKESTFESLNNVGVEVADMDGAETKIVTMGVNEIMDFLVRLFVSHSPLWDIVLGTAVNSGLPEIKPEVGIPLPNLEKDSTSNHTMMLKLTLQKSTNMLLFAHADQDFVNYLYSLLIIPMGRVNYHLGSNICTKIVDTLFTSVTHLFRNYFLIDELKATEFPLESLVRKGMYMITDDLSVTPLSLFSTVTLLGQLKIPLSDVKEDDFQIGIDEVFSILKVSFTSTRALTDVLLNPRLKKQLTPKLEK